MLSIRHVSHKFGGPPLLDGAGLEIRPGERLGLVGRNGAGKSTLLKIIAGVQQPDSAEWALKPGLRRAFLPQEVPESLPGNVETILSEALPEEWEDWQHAAALDKTLRATGLNPDATFDTLSAGMKRRVLLARSTIAEPDLLLLDEPTNHLDIPAIQWLEDFLLNSNFAILFVTHDRSFLQRLATRILDLERGRLSSWDCDYATYLRRKEEWLAGEEKQNAVFDKRLAQEEVWIRQGIKARRTRNEGRVRQLQKMRVEHQQRRERVGNVRFATDTSQRSGAKVIEAENVHFSYGDEPVILDFSALIERGDKVGIVGPNGAGKSTLVRLLLGKLAPTSGSVELGTQLQIAYFDQLREQLDPTKSVVENVADGAESVSIRGERKHVISYLKDFLFSPDRARSPVSMLSGGERNRLLLARLFTRPFNLLVLDEPTNDLDLETLELLEELLADFEGTLLLVSHDRSFLNNVVTDLLIVEGDGEVHSLVGGYDDYLAWKAARRPAVVLAKPAAPPPAAAARLAKGSRPSRDRKMLNRERRELDTLPSEIEALEHEQTEWMERMASPEFGRANPAEITAAKQRLSQIEASMHEKFTRWEELEALRNELEGD